MNINKTKLTLSIVTMALLAGCGGNQLDVAAYPNKVKNKVDIPEVCKPLYKSAMPTVAVIDFTNNSSFGKANSSTTDGNSHTKSSAAAVAGIVAAPGALGIGAAATSDTKTTSHTTSTSRQIDPKLAKSLTGPLETLIVQSGGAKLFTRADMDKVDAELKFQDSGLIDPDSAVEFGKTSGVKFIVTGSIDSVDQKYRDNSAAAGGVAKATQHSDNQTVRMLGSLLKMGASMTDGMVVSTKVTVKIIDVQTGKIVYTKQLNSSTNIGKIKHPTYDQIIGGIKKGMIESLPELNKDLSVYFAVKGYVTQIRRNGDDYIAQVNIGRDYKVVENQLFKVYIFDTNEDPMSGKISCDVIESTTKLRATNQIQKNTTWTTVEEGDGKTLKLGQLVQKSSEKGGFNVPKLPF